MENRRQLQPMHRAIVEHGTAQLGLFAGEDRRIFEVASQFLDDERVDPVYTHPGLCLTVLPHREIAAGTVWERQTGYARLMVHPLQGRDGRMPGVPFGAQARLMLIFLMTEAVRTRSRHVEPAARPPRRRARCRRCESPRAAFRRRARRRAVARRR